MIGNGYFVSDALVKEVPAVEGAPLPVPHQIRESRFQLPGFLSLASGNYDLCWGLDEPGTALGRLSISGGAEFIRFHDAAAEKAARLCISRSALALAVTTLAERL